MPIEISNGAVHKSMGHEDGEGRKEKRCCTATRSLYACMVQVIERAECILGMPILLDAQSPRLQKPLAYYTTGVNSTYK